MYEQKNWISGATQLLVEVSHSSVLTYSTFDFGRQQNFNCISTIVPRDIANTSVFKIREKLKLGLVAFVGTTHWLGNESHDRVEIVIGSGTSQFDILHLAQSDAINYSKNTEELIEIQEYDRNFGINIFHAETDTVEFAILNMPFNLLNFAVDIYEFCPDIVNQECGSIFNLIEIIEVTGQVLLWWD